MLQCPGFIVGSCYRRLGVAAFMCVNVLYVNILLVVYMNSVSIVMSCLRVTGKRHCQRPFLCNLRRVPQLACVYFEAPISGPLTVAIHVLRRLSWHSLCIRVCFIRTRDRVTRRRLLSAPVSSAPGVTVGTCDTAR